MNESLNNRPDELTKWSQKMYDKYNEMIEEKDKRIDDLLRVIFWFATRHKELYGKDDLYLVFGNTPTKEEDPHGTKGPFETKIIVTHPDKAEMEALEKEDPTLTQKKLKHWFKGIEYYGRLV